MALSIIEHIYHSYRPYDTLVVESDDQGIRTVPLADRTQLEPGLAVYRFGAGIYYANASRFTEEVMDLVEDADPKLRWLVVLGSGISDIDYSGADSVRQVHEELARLGVTLAFADLSGPVRRQLDDYGLTERLGAANIHGSLREVVAAYRATAAAPAPTPMPIPPAAPPSDAAGPAPA